MVDTIQSIKRVSNANGTQVLNSALLGSRRGNQSAGTDSEHGTNQRATCIHKGIVGRSIWKDNPTD